MADNQNNDIDGVSSLLKQLEEIGASGGELNLDDIDLASIGGMASDVSDEELDSLLSDSEEEDAELDFLASGFSASDIAPKDTEEEGEEGESLGMPPELEALFGDEASEDEGLPKLEEPEEQAEQIAPEEEPRPEAPSKPVKAAKSPPAQTEEEIMSDEEQLADLLAEMTQPDEDSSKTEEEPEAESDLSAISELLGEDANYDYLKGLEGAEDEDYDVFEDEEDVYDDGVEIPDFGFNESFTTTSTDGSGQGLIKKEPEPKAKSRRKGKKKEKTKEKRRLINENSALYKLLAPIFGKLAPILLIFGKIFGGAKKVRQKYRKNKTAQMVATIVIMLIILLVSGFVLFQQYRKLKSLIEENRVTVGEAPSNRLNYANYIYSTNARPLNGREITLVKIMLDKYLSGFWFDTHLRPERYFAELRDDKGRYYNIYPAARYSSGNDDPDEPTAYWFDGIKEDAEELYITIWDSTSLDSAVFEIDMKGYEMLPVRFIGTPKSVRTQEYNLDVSVESGTFSSALSSIVYKFEGRNGTEISFGREGVKAIISLENADRSIAPLYDIPLQYNVRDGMIIGRMDFNPVRNMDLKARLTFANLYKYYELGNYYNAAPLFAYNEENEIKIDFDIYSLVLEGMKKFGDKYVLVFHFENKAGERVYGEPEVSMYIKTYSGLELNLEPVVRSKTEGGDIVFEYQQPNSIIDNISPEEIYIEVHNSMIKMPDIVTDIQIPQLPDSPSEKSYSGIESFAEEAYTKRLAVKSGETADLTQYFDRSILNNQELNSLYTPQQTDAPPEYSVMVHTLARLSRNEFFAVVEESWLGVSGNNRIHYYKTHEVIIKQIGNNFVITDDRIKNYLEDDY